MQRDGRWPCSLPPPVISLVHGFTGPILPALCSPCHSSDFCSFWDVEKTEIRLRIQSQKASSPPQWGGCWNLPVERLPGGRRWLRSSWNVCPRALCPPHTWLSRLRKVKQAAPQRLWSSLTLLGSLIPPLSRSVKLRGHFTSECHFPVQWA